MATYASLAYAKSKMNATTTVEDAKLYDHLRAISRRIDREAHPHPPVRPIFEPYIETRRIPLSGALINPALQTLALPWSLLALSAVTVNTTALVVGTNVAVYPDTTQPPWRELRLLGCCGDWFSYCAGCDVSTVIVSGTWGIHRDYAKAWLQVDTLQAAVTDSATTLTVADVDGADLYGETNRISPGHLLKIDDEFLEVVAVNTSTNVVTVRRGANGSTAAAHDNSKAVYRWEVEEPVKYAVARQAGLMTARLGAYTTVNIDAAGTEVRYPADLLWELRAALADYAYEVS